jgi:hypothetical protein
MNKLNQIKFMYILEVAFEKETHHMSKYDRRFANRRFILSTKYRSPVTMTEERADNPQDKDIPPGCTPLVQVFVIIIPGGSNRNQQSPPLIGQQ